MKRLFVDTGGWMACADTKDPKHQDCLEARNGWLEDGGVLFTTDYVVDETLTLIRMRLGLDSAEKWWDNFSSSQRCVLWQVDEPLLDQARILFFSHRDKDYSFTDCTSFACMTSKKLTCALTTDRHFLQARFRVIPVLFIAGA